MSNARKSIAEEFRSFLERHAAAAPESDVPPAAPPAGRRGTAR